MTKVVFHIIIISDPLVSKFHPALLPVHSDQNVQKRSYSQKKPLLINESGDIPLPSEIKEKSESSESSSFSSESESKE